MSENKKKTIFKTKTDNLTKKPKLYKVLLLNDDYTTMDFVVAILVDIFSKSIEEARKIMLDVHKNGKGVAGVYPYDIANTKIEEVKKRSLENEFPLQTTLEEA